MSDHDHDHDHQHPHAEIIHAERPGYYDIMEAAVRELLIEKQLFGPEEIRRQSDEGGHHQRGANVRLPVIRLLRVELRRGLVK
jgi:hypothetical protein